jgi:DNA recombination protein RmuC
MVSMPGGQAYDCQGMTVLTITTIVVGFNLVLTIVVLVMLALRRSGAAAPQIDERALAEVGGGLRQDLSAQRQELGAAIGDGSRALEVRLTSLLGDQKVTADRALELQRTSQAELRANLDQGLAHLRDKFHEHSQAAVTADAGLRSSVEKRFDELRTANEAKLEKVREAVEKLERSNALALEANAERVRILAEQNATKHQELQESVRVEFGKMKSGNEEKLDAVKQTIEQLQVSNAEKQRELQESLRQELDKLRTGNEAKLEKMRETVDEKLQGTLEKRLGESFTLVSERLELVQRGLGEMQALASDVGGLKRVLTNVKSRGSWGEVQLSRQLEDLLTHEQYVQNLTVKDGTAESVEFAVKLPGRSAEEAVYLPIDSKLPQEDYERLLNAQDEGDKTAIDAAAKMLERAIIAQAKTISAKYIAPPKTTDFAIMYLPTEGLFAEVIRQPGLASKLQNDHRVLVTGPTTLMSLLNSLQMGFRTLAIEQRSSEVWKVLSAAKDEFQKYGKVWEKLGKQLETAQNTVREAGVRTRAVERKLRTVETLEVDQIAELPSELTESEDVAEIVGLDPAS